MIKSIVEINGTEFELILDKELNISDFIYSLSKQMNGDYVKVEDCIYNGKKKYIKEIFLQSVDYVSYDVSNHINCQHEKGRRTSALSDYWKCSKCGEYFKGN